jgi:MraZ protein
LGPENGFFGRYDHSLDAKGRLILPVRIRNRLGSLCFLTPHLDGCLAIWPPETFRAEVELRHASAIDSFARAQVREWSSAVDETEVDPQGRILVAADLRAYAALEREVVIVGVIDHVELWSPPMWNATVLVPSGAGATTGA